MISVEQAKELLLKHLRQENLINHSIAVALVMKSLAEIFEQDKDEWYIIGLLHDIDYDLTYDNPQQHSLLAMDLLKDYDLKPYMLDAIRRHSGNEALISIADKALWCADPVTGLITATALMNPEKKVSAVKLSSLKKKFKNKNFAAGANREQIATCQSLSFTIDEFLQLSLDAMS